MTSTAINENRLTSYRPVKNLCHDYLLLLLDEQKVDKYVNVNLYPEGKNHFSLNVERV